MGIFIDFYAEPKQISSREWEETFNETLKIAQAGKLCEIVKREFEGNSYYVGIPVGNNDYDTEDGMEITGELVTGSIMETHVIPRVFGVDTPVAESGTTMLALGLDEPEQYGLKAPEVQHILFNKTQGSAAHIWLLAIVCVFCSRFPFATSVSGDISAGQINRAIRLAESVLGRMLTPPVVYDAERLLSLVRELVKGDEFATARLFFALFRGLKNKDFNQFVKENFTTDALYQMFRADAENKSIHSILKDWLLLGLPLKDVARMLVSDPEGPQHKPEELVKTVLRAKLHIEEKLTYDAAFADNANEEPDDISMLLTRMGALIMGIRNWAVDCYIPMPEIKAVCAEVFGSGYNVDVLFDNAAAELEQNETARAAAEIYEKIEEGKQDYEQYALWDMKQMYFWEGGDSVRPELFTELETFVRKAYEVTTETRNELLSADRAGRIRLLTVHGGDRFLLPLEKWDAIFSGVTDDAKMSRYITIFGVQLNGSGVKEMARVLLYNDVLYSEIWSRVFGEA